MKKRWWAILVLLCVLLGGCASEEDKNAAKPVIDKINGLETVTLESANYIYEIHKEYEALSDTQKKLVVNDDAFMEAITQLEELADEEETDHDPTNTITEEDLIGIWQEEGNPAHKGYLYFTQQGYIYYVASKEAVTETDFTHDYIISIRYKLGEYDRIMREKEGEFYCIPSKQDFSFSVTKTVDGEMTLNVKGEIIGGTYYKSGEKVDLEPEQCQHDGCVEMAVTSGDSRYCEEHSNKCVECGDYIDEDAEICLKCLVEELKVYK